MARPFSLTVLHGPHLTVAAAGHAQLCDLVGLFDLAARVTHGCHYSRALRNLYEVEVAFSFTEHLSLGMHAAEALRSLDRAASVVHPQYRVGTSERAAQKAGLPFRTFTDLDEATAWLAGGAPGAIQAMKPADR